MTKKPAGGSPEWFEKIEAPMRRREQLAREKPERHPYDYDGAIERADRSMKQQLGMLRASHEQGGAQLTARHPSGPLHFEPRPAGRPLQRNMYSRRPSSDPLSVGEIVELRPLEFPRLGLTAKIVEIAGDQLTVEAERLVDWDTRTLVVEAGEKLVVCEDDVRCIEFRLGG